MGAPRRQPGSRRRIACALALLAASALALLLLLASRSAPPRYGVIIDAGSTGSRVHVIAYRAGPGRGATPQLDWARTASLKANPGLSSFAADPRGAGLSLAPLVEFARRRVPRERWADTEVRLMATAGLRLLDAAVAESVLESCRDVLRQSGFLFQDKWATVISGMLYTVNCSDFYVILVPCYGNMLNWSSCMRWISIAGSTSVEFGSLHFSTLDVVVLNWCSARSVELNSVFTKVIMQVHENAVQGLRKVYMHGLQQIMHWGL